MLLDEMPTIVLPISFLENATKLSEPRCILVEIWGLGDKVEKPFDEPRNGGSTLFGEQLGSRYHFLIHAQREFRHIRIILAFLYVSKGRLSNTGIPRRLKQLPNLTKQK